VPPDTDVLRVRSWYVLDTDGKEHLIVRGLERRNCLDGHFMYNTFPPFRDYFPFPTHANIAKVEIWICETFGFEREQLPSPFTGKEKSRPRKVCDCRLESIQCYSAVIKQRLFEIDAEPAQICSICDPSGGSRVLS
jgi:hypothetical protein